MARRSVGVLAYVLLTGCSPFGGETTQETFLNVTQVRLDFPDELFAEISKDAIDFVTTLLRRNPRSVGVLAYVLLTGCSPFGGETTQETFLNVTQVRLDFPDELFAEISKDAIDFVTTLLRRNPRVSHLERVSPGLRYFYARFPTFMTTLPTTGAEIPKAPD
ncbi:unnamed protein product [Cyprideis torosa]|uniref:Uncharacterized protein n=1 Tax=Cyprideis torosa TaxID=163714 RepID=A0A7R8WDV9_9CRUS|nr:unnamed protein product [Cyprideis torosa]CAG0888760.1 unnamed protein product [Cyprideis torosa]